MSQHRARRARRAAPVSLTARVSTWLRRRRVAYRLRRLNRRRADLGPAVRKVAAAGLAVAGLLLLLSPDRSSDARAQGSAVVVAAHDLTAGTTVSAADVRIEYVAAAPSGALTEPADAIGQQVAGQIRAGEILTDIRLLASATPDGLVPVVVAVTDPASVHPLRAGQCVDVFAGYNGLPLQQVSDDALLISILNGSADERRIGNQAAKHLVLGVTQDAVSSLVIAMSSDIVLATVCGS